MGEAQSATIIANVVPLVSGAVNLLQRPPQKHNGALHRWMVAVPADSTSTSQTLDVVPEEDSCSLQWNDDFHSIFLSHSGAQKSFVEQLCVDIERYDRYPFFDKCRDSLPIGCHFPKVIFDAIEKCRVGVVVLSEEFFSGSKWPMLELVAMVKRRTHDPKFIIMPVFLHIKRAECRNKVNHNQWLTQHWQGWAKEDNKIDLKKWQEALEVFGPINGVCLNDKLDEVKCRGEVVEALCKEVPPRTRWDDSHVQGRSRMCSAIRGKIDGLQLSKSYGVRILGVYGVGGIGKTTACKVVCNDYFKEFEGRVCHIEFGIGSKLFRLQEILKRLTRTEEELVKNFSEDECKDRLKRSLKRKVLLAIDNVSDAQYIVNEGMDILRVRFPKGSIVIVTARSQSQLGYLKISREECIEMPNLEEDDARSLFLYHAAPGSYLKNVDKANELVLKKCIQRCYFGKGDGISYHYHPLALQTLGGQFGNDPEAWNKNLNEDVFNRYQEDNKDHPIYSILGISFEKLRLEDKYLFIDATIFVPHGCIMNTIDWLSMVHGRSVSDIKRRLEGLKNKSLLENLDEGSGMIRVHDLKRGFAAMKVEVAEFELRPWVFEKAYAPRREESCLSGGGWESLQRVYIITGTWNGPYGIVKELNLSQCSNLGVLKLQCVEIESGVLDVRSLLQLKSLQLSCIIGPKCFGGVLQILGLKSLTNLVYLDLKIPTTKATFVHEEIWSLTNLRVYVAEGFQCKFGVPNIVTLEKREAEYARLLQLQILDLYELALLELLDLSSFPQLRKLVIHFCHKLIELTSIAPLTALEHIEFYKCKNLKTIPNLNHFVALQHFKLFWLPSLQVLVAPRYKFEIPDLIPSEKLHGEFVYFPQLQTLDMYQVAILELPELNNFPKLRKLSISNCNMMTGLMSSAPLTALKDLDISDCKSFNVLPHMNHFVALNYLRVWDCGEVQLTTHDIEMLEAMCDGLQILFMRSSNNTSVRSEGTSRMMLEKTPYEEHVEEEPSHLNTNNCSEILVSSTDKLTIRYTGDGESCGSIQANCPAPRCSGIYYFELTVKDLGKDGCIGIGYTNENFLSSSMPGWKYNGYGYHGDDGMLYCEQGKGKPYAEGFTTSDTVGAAINFVAQEIFFTRNGKVLPVVSFVDGKSPYYPTIGLGSPMEKVEVNFGTRKFVFDFESVFRRARS